MMRYCPNCHTERSVDEFFCAGTIHGVECNWDLSQVPIRAEGWRPQEVRTIEAGKEDPAPPSLACVNGHSMSEGDLM